MKKAIVLLLCVFSIASLAACGNAGKANTTNPSSNVQIPNPFVDCKTLDDASAIAHFNMTVPESINGYSERMIQAVADKMIQVLYFDGEDKALIRKAEGTGDISGDYNEYAEINSISVGDVKVSTKGNSGMISVATWAADGFTYAIDINNGGMTVETISALVAAIQ